MTAAEAAGAIAATESGTAEGQVAGVDPLDDLVGLRPRQTAVLDGLLDPVDERLLESGLQLGGFDPELLGRVVDDGLLLFLGLGPVGRDRRAGTGKGRDGEAGDDEILPDLHESTPRMRQSTMRHL